MESVVFSNLKKRYGQVHALNGVSLNIHEGELFGIIGPDGAGKTTLFRILTSLLLPDTGNATVAGFDVIHNYQKVRQCIGYMPEHFALYQDLSVNENLHFFASVFGTSVRHNYELIRDIYQQIEPFGDRRAGKLSGGMKQKLALCCALIHRPQVLFLDEPTTGVDAVSRQEFWQMLASIRKQGITIIASTPYMDEATRCERIALMQNGRFMQINTPQAIAEAFPHPLWAVRSNSMHRLADHLRAYPHTLSAYSFGDCIHATFCRQIDRSDLICYLQNKGHAELNVQHIPAGIEDCFIQLDNGSTPNQNSL